MKPPADTPEPPLPPAVVVHSLAHARHALGAGCKVTLLSARAAAGFAGAAWWMALIRQASPQSDAASCPDILDCGDLPGRALEALSLGQRLVRLDAGLAAYADLQERAGRLGARLLAERPACLDLGVPGAELRLGAWLRIDIEVRET